MPTPDFILRLREKVGHEPLWLVGVSCVVERAGEVLLVRRADTGAWTPIGGIVEPGEEVAIAGAREILEETGVVAEPVRIASVRATDPVVYPNGDVTAYTDVCLRFRYVSGHPHAADDESTEARWWPLAELPPMKDRHLENIGHALADAPAAFFLT